MVKKIRFKNLIFMIIMALVFAMGCGSSDASKDDIISEEQVTEENNNEEDLQDITDEEEIEEADEKTTKEDEESENITEIEEDKSKTPLENHGELYVDGTHLLDCNGNIFQLKGVSTHGLQWYPEYVNYDAFKTMRDEWGINCVRLAMYSDEGDGYCSGGDKEWLKGIVNDGVSYATDLGMYVIIDWHVLGERDPNVHKQDAIAFFDEMSKKYADYDNVLYEICNEPNGGTSWSQVKSYAEEVIPVIKANNPDAIIIIGTPNWSQDVDIAASDPVKGYSNIMYTIHFYAESHRDELRQKVMIALNKGLPIFCTEFGICDASGNGAINISEANKWIDVFDNAGISYCIWNLSNKAESSSLINSNCSSVTGWTYNDLSEEGKWYLGILGGDAVGETAQATQTTQENNSNNNANNNNVEASSSNGSLKADIVNSGNWNDGSNDFYQYTVTLNAIGGNVSNWKITVNFGSNITLDQSWSGNYSVSGGNITVTSVDYNQTINSGNSVEIGFIIKTNGNPGTPSITIN